MKASPWWLWLLVGLAIVPMLIPAWRRYQVSRLRLTPPRRWGLKNAVPSRLKPRSSYLTPRGQPEGRRISRIWFVVAISCLIAIPVLIFLAGLVYNRIVIDPLRPPVYSIRVRPAAIWHHAEFVVSPAYGFQLAITRRLYSVTIFATLVAITSGTLKIVPDWSRHISRCRRGSTSIIGCLKIRVRRMQQVSILK